MRYSSRNICCVLVCCCWLIVSPTRAADITWNGNGTGIGGRNSDSWQNVDNWNRFGSPFATHRVPSDGDTATIQSFLGRTVRLNDDTAPIDRLRISGVELDTNGHLLQVDDKGTATTFIDGSSLIGTNLIVSPRVGGGIAFHTDNLEVYGASIVDERGSLTVSGEAQIDGATLVRGAGGAFYAAADAIVKFGGDVTVSDRGVMSLGQTSGNGSSFATGSTVTVDGGYLFFVVLEAKISLSRNQHLEIRDSGSLGFLQSTFSEFAVGDGGVGNLTVAGPTSYVIGPANDTSQIVVGHESTGMGRIEVSNGGIFQTRDAQSIIKSTGTLAIDGGTFEASADVVLDGGMMSVSNGGVFDLDNSKSFTVRNGGLAFFEEPITIDQNPGYRLEGGQFIAREISFDPNALGQFQLTGGELSVERYNATFVNQGGTLAPGNASTGSGTGSTRITGDYTVVDAESVLQLEIGGVGMGTDSDFVEVSGNASFDGLLQLELANGFTPQGNDTFLVFNANSIGGFFDNVGNGARLETTDGSGSFKVNYGVGSPFDESRMVLSDFIAGGQGLLGDFNNDGVLSAIDIDLLSAAVGGTDGSFDLNADGLVTTADRSVWIEDLSKTFFGDADLNQSVDFPDFLALSASFGGVAGWAGGDFDGSGNVTFPDFLLLSANYGSSIAGATAIPEPAAASLAMIGLLGAFGFRRRD